MKLGLVFGCGDIVPQEAHIIDLEHNNAPQIFKLCLDDSDYPPDMIIEMAREIIDVYNSTKKFGKALKRMGIMIK